MTFREFQQKIAEEYPESETWIYNKTYHFRCGVSQGAFLTEQNEWYFQCGSQGWGSTLEEAIANERQNYNESYQEFCLEAS